VENLEYTQIGFTISDSGIGIAEDSVDMLFEVYDLSYSNNHVKVGGSGLGLVITKKLLDYMNTTIFVESEIGKGTKFYFTIKFKNSEMSFSKIKNKYSERINFIENRLPKGIRILLVEDYLINQLVVSEFLSKWEIHLDIADNGLQALENINEKSYDLILMDLQMPDMDGFQATKMIRDHVDFSKSMVPIIAMTASPASEIHEKVKASGMNDFISKPFEPEDLFNKIIRHLENKNHST
jgi:CheY-like chemotaxis protein